MSETGADPPARVAMTLDFSVSAAGWLAAQPEHMVRAARVIIALRARRGEELSDGARWFNSGQIYGMGLVLSYCGDPDDISDTAAEGFISAVESADQMVAGAAAEGAVVNGEMPAGPVITVVADGEAHPGEVLMSGPTWVTIGWDGRTADFDPDTRRAKSGADVYFTIEENDR